MVPEWKQTQTVGEGGRLEVVIPGLRGGEVVEVLVRRAGATAPLAGTAERPVGLLEGRVRMKPDFDLPLDEFDPYT